jgi:hypothetical protein
MRARATVAALAVAALGTLPSRDAHAWCSTTTQPAMVPGECASGGTALLWQSLCATYSLYTLNFPDSPTLDDVRTQAALAAGRWHQTACDASPSDTPYFVLSPGPDTTTPSGYNPHGFNANTVSFNTRWHSDAIHTYGAIAVTIVTFDHVSGEILDADTELNLVSDANPNGFQFSTDASMAGVSDGGQIDGAYADLPTVLTHEFGHFHGLGHSADETAVMWFTAGLGEQRRDLRPDDIAGICTSYPPGTAPEGRSCNPVPYGGLALTPTGNKITGGCSAGPAPRSGARPVSAALVALGLCGTAVALRRRARRG